MGLFSGPGLTPNLKGAPTNIIELQASATYTLPAGWQMVKPGGYTSIQQFDPVAGFWRKVGGGSPGAGSQEYVYSDGVNYRLANQTGCVVGALITNAGSGYTSAPTVTIASQNSIWRAIVGGAVNTSVTVTAGGSGYTYAPIVLFSAPPSGGIQATGYCTLTSGAVSSVTVVDQGAGYVSAPTVTFINDPREVSNPLLTAGVGAAAACTLTGAQTVTGIICTDHGSSQNSSVPSFTFAGGGGSSLAATCIMCWSITAYAAGTAGAGLAGTTAWITAEDAFPTAAAAYLNPSTQSGLVSKRKADIKAPITGAGITATGLVVYDGGIYTSVPTALVIPTASVVTTAPVVTFTMGGQNDISEVTPV